MHRLRRKAVAKATPTDIGATKWQSSECVLVAETNGTLIRIAGSHVRSYGLGGILGQLSTSTAGRIEAKVEYDGELNGNVIFGAVKRSSDVSTLLSEVSRKVVMVLNEDRTEISVMDNANTLHPEFYTLARIP
jgi:hypothetical protein